MVISDNPNYVKILKGIAQYIKENQVESLLDGREGIISFWINGVKNHAHQVGLINTKQLEELDANLEQLRLSNNSSGIKAILE